MASELSDREMAEAEEVAFLEALAKWETKPNQEQRMLSPRRHFFHAGYDADYIKMRDELLAAAERIVEKYS